MVDNQGPDTPQSANSLFNEDVFTETPETQANEGSAQENTLTPTDAFTAPSGEEAPQEAPSVEETPQPVDPKNDERRYQYWQSQAAKRENELRQMQERMQTYEQNMQQPAQPYAPQQQEPQREEFPDPPEKPGKPRNFNRQEAFEDASSESARYLDEVEEWRDNMDEYNTLRVQYENAVTQERIQNQEAQRRQTEAQRQAYRQQQEQLSQVNELVQGHYGLSPEESQEFIQTMSDPSSITVDNLVQLYRLQKGKGGGAPVNPGQSPQPSPSFQQAQRAQQVPQPMGVQPTAGNNQAPAEDQIMDNMIADFKSKNPW